MVKVVNFHPENLSWIPIGTHVSNYNNNNNNRISIAPYGRNFRGGVRKGVWPKFLACTAKGRHYTCECLSLHKSECTTLKKASSLLQFFYIVH